MKRYYVYKLIDIVSGEFYYGSRGFNGDIKEDNYMGSPKVWSPDLKNLKKEIIKEFNNREDAILFERELIVKYVNHNKNRNYSIPHPKIHRENLITAKDVNGKIVTIKKDDPLFGVEFFGVTKNMVLVKDSNGTTFYVDKNDERYLKGELKHNNVGLMIGEAHPNTNKKWVTDGTEQKLINLGSEIPYGWVLGTSQKGKTTNSSHKGSCWVCNKGNNKSKRVSSDELEHYLLNGYNKGRCKLQEYKKNDNRKVVTPDFKDYIWINNPKLKKNKRVKKEMVSEFLNDGWELKMVRYGK